MYIVLGGTGHVGAALAKRLVAAGQPTLVTTHDAAKADALRATGVEAAVVDVRDVEALRAVLRRGRRAFLLNPPADPATDTDVEEKRTALAIAAALEGAGLEKVVAESTYGAQSIERAGDLGVLYDFEQAILARDIPTAFVRAAYYMSNWDAALQTARDEGVVHTMFAGDFKLPQIAPDDLGQAAFELITGPVEVTGVRYAEGPERYSTADVAAAFAKALGRPVEAVTTPRDQWTAAFKALGFSDPAAESYARMTAVTVDGGFPPAEQAWRGKTTLEAHVEALVEASAR